MKDIETLLQRCDFSQESTQKNQLFYELFHKPVPVNSSIRPLAMEELGMVAGGRPILPEDPDQTDKP